jgi:hypothetical protein
MARILTILDEMLEGTMRALADGDADAAYAAAPWTRRSTSSTTRSSASC